MLHQAGVFSDQGVEELAALPLDTEDGLPLGRAHESMRFSIEDIPRKNLEIVMGLKWLASSLAMNMMNLSWI